MYPGPCKGAAQGPCKALPTPSPIECFYMTASLTRSPWLLSFLDISVGQLQQILRPLILKQRNFFAQLLLRLLPRLVKLAVLKESYSI